jgi:hypothetical protein
VCCENDGFAAYIATFAFLGRRCCERNTVRLREEALALPAHLGDVVRCRNWAQTENIARFQTKLSENKGSLRTTLGENETTLDDMSRQAATPAATLSAV